MTSDVSPERGQEPARRVVVVSMLNRPTARLVEYVQQLVARGDRVDLLLSRPEGWDELEAEVHPRPNFHAGKRPENKLFVRRAERLLVFRGPEGVSTLLERTAGRRFGKPVAKLTGAQRRASNIVHGRMFTPVYQLFRSQLLAGQFKAALRSVDFNEVDLIVAADIYAVTLAARLARRYPAVRVTTGLEL